MFTASIVLYKENNSVLKKTVDSFLNTTLIKKRLYLIDNSPTDILRNQYINNDITYIFVGENIGFGAAHNLILEKIKNQSDFHLILNPDVFFAPSVIPNLIKVLKKELEVVMISPKVIFLDGKEQYTCRKYPSILQMILRRVNFFKSYIDQKMYQQLDLETSFYPECIHGCFLLFKTPDLITLKGFDERYFLYMEDVDICKKIDTLGKKKIYFPKEQITHVLKQGSSKDIKLFFNHVSSAIKYFLKWWRF